MNTRFLHRPTTVRRLFRARVIGILALTTTAGAGLGGCGAISPFSAASFLQTFIGPSTPVGPPIVNPPTSDFPGLCTLEGDERTITIELRNESPATIHYALVLVTTTGPGGFVCQSARQEYLDFGYERETVDAEGKKQFACETAVLDRGNQLLAARMTGTIAPREAGDPFTIASEPLNGSTAIPMPTEILLGTDLLTVDLNVNFACTTANVCVSLAEGICGQGGFLYVTSDICRIPATRTQGTLCNARMGSLRPRWVLRNPTLIDREARPFEYVKGGDIIITVLNRRSDTNPNNNQVVWQVLDKDNRVVHQETR
jgi:hypothetical protein